MQKFTFDLEPESFCQDFGYNPLFDKFSDNLCSPPELVSCATNDELNFMDFNKCLEPKELQGADEANELNLAVQSSPNIAERRAEHNAIERARRECLNSKFQKLAKNLPNLQTYRRPSKGKIVEKALDWIMQSQRREERYQQEIKRLQNENKLLVQNSESPKANSVYEIGELGITNGFNKEFYQNDQNELMKYPETPITFKEESPVNSPLTKNNDRNKIANKDIFKNSFENSSYNMTEFNTPSISPYTKKQPYSVCLHPQTLLLRRGSGIPGK